MSLLPEISTIINLAELCTRQEICGVVDKAGTVYPIRNTSRYRDDFVFNKADWFRLLNSKVDIAYLYHSHLTGNPEPSEQDLKSQANHKYDLLIVAGESWRYIPYEP